MKSLSLLLLLLMSATAAAQQGQFSVGTGVQYSGGYLPGVKYSVALTDTSQYFVSSTIYTIAGGYQFSLKNIDKLSFSVGAGSFHFFEDLNPYGFANMTYHPTGFRQSGFEFGLGFAFEKGESSQLVLDLGYKF